MSERNYYVICDDNCRFPAMTKEEVIAAIAEATGHTPVDIDDAFITKIKEGNGNRPLKFWCGTQAQYNAITPEEDVFYIITDVNELDELQATVREQGLTISNIQSFAQLNRDMIFSLDSRLTLIDDFVVDISTVDGWEVRKWTSGKVETFKEITFENIEFTQWSPLYLKMNLQINYPADVFQTVNNVFLSTDNQYVWTGGVQINTAKAFTNLIKCSAEEISIIKIRVKIEGTFDTSTLDD